MTKASNNPFPSVLFAEQGSNPSTPAAGYWRAYFKSGGLYVIDDAGVVTGPLVGSTELDYAQITSDVNITGTSDGAADTIITGSSVTYDGSTAILIHVYSPRLQAPNGASAYTYVSIYEDATLKGYVGIVRLGSASANNWIVLNGYYRYTPSAGAKVITVKGVVSTGTGVFGAGATGTDYVPAFLRITRA